MRLNVDDREYLRKRFKILIPQMKKSEIVKHFEMEEIARRIIYKTIDPMQNEGYIKDKSKSARPNTWTPVRRSQLKRLVNNRKGVSQRRLGRKFGLDQSVIIRKISERGILITNVKKHQNILRLRDIKQRTIAKSLPIHFIVYYVA